MDPTELGNNRTGTQMSPRDFRRMQEGVDAMTAAIEDNGGTPLAGDAAVLAIGDFRAEYLLDAEPLGSVPVPGTLTGMARSGMDMLTGTRMQALVDKMGERLAFERSGTRLYEALISKARVRTDEVPELTLGRLEQIRDEEAQHFAMLCEAMEELGADPTAQTPCADLSGVESMGLLKAVVDPRTSVAQSLHAILSAELIDNAGWELLVELARESGHDKLAERFSAALLQEGEHLATIRSWFTAATLATASLGGKARQGKTH